MDCETCRFGKSKGMADVCRICRNGSEWEPKKDHECQCKDKPSGNYELLGRSIGSLVDEKQAAYGNSFGKTGDFLKLLYPDGIRPDQYGDALALVRIFDKQMRIATDKDALGESPYRDIAGYGLLGAAKDGE